MQSCGDLFIGGGTNISSNAGLYAVNCVLSDTNDDMCCARRNSFTGIRIGEDCSIGHGAVVFDGTDLGNQSIVSPNVVVRGKYVPNSRVTG